jgi:hypothetical protein
MATMAGPALPAERIDHFTGTPRAKAADRWIYVFTAAIFVIITLTGFIPDSLDKMADVAAGKRPPFPLVMHLHAVLMGAFLMLLLTQTWLAATGRIGWHARLGVLTAIIVPALVVVGFVLAPTIYQETLQIARSAAPDAQDKLQALIVRKETILLNQIRMGILFPLFIVVGLNARRTDAGLHKRMMILATAVVMGPAINRILWLPTTYPGSLVSGDLYMLLALAPMLVLDVIRNRYVHKAYLIWVGIGLPFTVAAYMLWNTPWWHMVARVFLTS